MPAAYPVPTKMVQQLWDRFIVFLMRSYPLKDFPLNIRPGMVFATAAWVILLGILGMAPLPTLPINDKALHFFGLGFATFLLYFVLEVPEGAGRRIWYFRRAPLLFTLVGAFFFGGIWKTFQFGDIVANLLGSTLFLYLAHLAHKRHLRKLELSSLYQPLSVQSSQTYRDAQGRSHRFNTNADATGLNENDNDTSGTERNNANATVGGAVYTHGGQGGHGYSGGGRDRSGSEIWESDSDLGRSSQETARGGGRGGYDTAPGAGAGARGAGAFALGDEDDDDDDSNSK
ncbi:hypothetical protein I317_02549 [Kwoniella heveanensis CBS 569]|nr:hypothetical protein I317_02549 [Kwoniella heveanensis CBS 569]